MKVIDYNEIRSIVSMLFPEFDTSTLKDTDDLQTFFSMNSMDFIKTVIVLEKRFECDLTTIITSPKDFNIKYLVHFIRMSE